MSALTTQSGYARPLWLSGMGTGVFGLAAVWMWNPAASGVFPPCPVYVLTGWFCPGCGSLRAIHQLLHGHLLAAFAMNPLAVIALPFLLYGLASHLSFQIRGRHLPGIFLPAFSIWALCIAILAFGIARNIAAYPFSLLAPGGMLRL
jgi:hypothetical protein